MIGQTISHYKILEKLGGGGMGIVYKAQDLKLDRFVALKFLLPHLSPDGEEKQRFINEARAASALDHPNICNIHEIDETEDGQLFIAMGYYEGETLKKKVTSDQLSVGSATDIAIQITHGLAKAHAHGIVHRDLKPENVIITKEGVVKIVDFGLAKLSGHTRLTKDGETKGTAAYMSPEQARGEDTDHRTDIWSMGVMLYEMLAGQLPFRGEKAPAIIYAILTKQPKPVSESRSEIPATLESIINRMLTKDAEKRYQLADEALVDLNAFRQSSATGRIEKRRTTSFRGIGKRAYLYGSIAMILVFLFSLWLYTLFSPHRSIDSIAVLPFINESADPNVEYLSDGLSESLIQRLSQLPRLKVMSFSVVSRYKGKEINPQELGRDLKVQAVLVGRVAQRGETLSISAELVDTQDNRHIWGGQYQRKMAEILALQAEFSKEISDQLRLRLSGEEKQRLSRSYGENAEAYQFYLKGRYYGAKATEEGFKKGIEFFNQAIAKAPNYALAYVGLAEAYYIGSSYYLPPKEAMPRLKQAALKAIEIDNTLAEAHAALALAKAFYDWDSPGAESEFKLAIALNPNYENTRQFYGGFLVMEGRFEEGLAEMKRAREIDPLSLLIIAYSGLQYIYARQYDRAIELCQSALDMEANYWLAHDFLGVAHQLKGNLPEAIAAFQKAKQLDDSPWILVRLGCAYAASGMGAEAQKMLEELQELSKRRYVSALGIANIYAALGENDQAFVWLEKACDNRDENVCWLKVDPMFDSLRSDSRFSALLKKIGVDK